MKKLLVAAFGAVVLLGITGTTTFANEIAIYEDQKADTRKDIKVEELPDAVKKALASEDHKDFNPQSATLVITAGKTTYEVTGIKAEQTVTLYFAENGSPIVK